MLRGLTTVTYLATDVPAAVDWYTELLAAEPYFRRDADGSPAYVEWRIGDYRHELGVMDARFAPAGAGHDGSGTITYWAVDDARAAHARLLALGATNHGDPTERGPGFVTASVLDPFGNVLGIMENQHYLEVLQGH
ncbi:MAG: VOC family protein [Phycicoccus sp.]